MIGAGSVVTKDIPPYSVAAGNPCRQIRLRFPEPIVQRLLDLRWWELDESRLREFAPLFSTPESFLIAMEKE